MNDTQANTSKASGGQGTETQLIESRNGQGDTPTVLLPSTAPPPARGQGQFSLDPHHQRRDLGFLARAVREGWLGDYSLTRADYDALTQLAREQLASGDERRAALGARTLMEMASHNLRYAEAQDKAQRLDEGSATEVYEFGDIQFRGGKQLGPGGSHAGREPD